MNMAVKKKATRNLGGTVLQLCTLLVLVCSNLKVSTSGSATLVNDLPNEGSTTIAKYVASTSEIVDDNSSPQARIQLPSLPVLNESFSACLLVMDENFRLHEWISYHYHVLPLRYLVIAVDPRSQQPPDAILDQFREHVNMTIVSWKDADFLSDSVGPLRENARLKKKRKRHLARQRQFLGQCLSHLRQHNRTWTALWDTDEYIAYNRFESTRTNQNRTAKAATDMSEPGTILRYLNDFGEDKCITMPRVLVGNKETPGLLNESHAVDPRRFDTVRFRFRGRLGDRAHGFGKSLLNVRQIPSFPVLVNNPHRPVMEICPEVAGMQLCRSPFYLSHFIGSWEAYSYRDDSRRGGQDKNYGAYIERAQQNHVYENKLAPWIPAFISSIGEERGTILLKEAGLDPEYNASFKISAWECAGCK